MQKTKPVSDESILERLAIEGGEPIRSKPWPTYDKGNVILDKNDEIELLAALRSKLLFRYDLRPLAETPVGKFEKAAEEFFGVKHALAVSSGTTAITLALMSLDIKSGNEVALPGFTFAATPSAILLAGAKPVLIEVDENLNLDIDDLKRKYNPRMKALVVVHMRGSASDMKSIMEFADSVGLKVIEDAVPAMGVKFCSKYLGTWGHFGAFSTQSDKSCNTGEGGLLLVNDDLLFAKSAVLSGAYEGRWKKHFVSRDIDFEDSYYPIYSFRMDNLRGALAYSQMNKLPTRLKKLCENYIYVVKELSKLKGIRIRKTLGNESILGDSLLFTLQDYSLQDIVWFSKALNAEGIQCSAFGNSENRNIRCFWSWGFLFPNTTIEERKALLPKTSRYLERFIDIPLSPTLEKNDLDDLVLSIKKVLARMKER